MYAHQILDDMQALLKKVTQAGIKSFSSEQQRYYETIWMALPMINQSQKFYMGEASEVHDLDKKNHRLFLDNCETLRLPYKMCFFEFSNYKGDVDPGKYLDSKIAILAAQTSPKAWYVSIFSYFTADLRWIMSPVGFHIMIGGATKETIESVVQFFEEGKRKFSKSPYYYNEEQFNNTIRNLHAQIKNSPSEKGSIQPFNILGVPENELTELIHDHISDLSLLEISVKLLNCKNIRIETIKASEKLNKKRRKNGKAEIFDYKVLSVFKPGNKQDYRQGSTPLSHNRVHLCRGHFKEFTTEHPLLGKHTGLFWWQPHVRGQNRDGIVIKEYDVINEKKEKL